MHPQDHQEIPPIGEAEVEAPDLVMARGEERVQQQEVDRGLLEMEPLREVVAEVAQVNPLMDQHQVDPSL